MRHGWKFRKLGRDTVHRRALLKNLATALVKHERIVTTLAKAKELRRVGDRVNLYTVRVSMLSTYRLAPPDHNAGEEKHCRVQSRGRALDEGQ